MPRTPNLRWVSRAARFVKADLWRIRQKDLERPLSILIRLLRITVLTFRGLAGDRLHLRASALTYYSALSIIPVLAIGFGIAKGFGFEKTLEILLIDKMQGQEEVAARIVEFARKVLENVRGGLMAVIALAFLLWTVIKVLSHIESALNDIWGVKKSRSLGQKITNYLSLMLIAPFLLIASSTLTIVITSQVELVVQKTNLLGAVSPAIHFMLGLLPYGVLWFLFSFLYIFMPNTKVNFSSGLLAGIIAGTIYQIFQWGYITFQIGVAKYNAIYGSFAALPLFFIWLHLSWLIVLFGAEISFAHQNLNTFEFEPDCRTVSSSFKRLLSLRMVHLLVRHFSQGRRDLDDVMISHELEIPITLVRQLLFELVEAEVVSEVVMGQGRSATYHPARDPEGMTIKSVIDALEEHGSNNVPVAWSEDMQKLAESLETFSDLVERSPANKPLKAI